MVVIDACGAGELPDAADYGDAGANTLVHLAEAVGGLRLPTLSAWASARSSRSRAARPPRDPVVHGRLIRRPGQGVHDRPLGAHGRVPPAPLRTYPEGFPRDVVTRLRGGDRPRVLCNRPYNGIAVIDAFGEEHLATGALILYTSADSVLQIAAHYERPTEASS